MDTLTGEPMKIFETFLDLLFKKREARLANVPVATAMPVQALALPAPDIQIIDVQEPVLDAILIEDMTAKAEIDISMSLQTESIWMAMSSMTITWGSVFSPQSMRST